MADTGRNYIIYAMKGSPLELDLSGDTNTFTISWLDSGDGTLTETGTISGGGTLMLEPPLRDINRPWAAWLKNSR